MKFVELDIKKHDLEKVANFIYETELSVFKPMIGPDKNTAVENITHLIQLGNNTFGQENIRVVSDEQDNVHGILVAYDDNLSIWDDLKAYYLILDASGFIKYVTKGVAISQLLTASLKKDDLYLSNIVVDPSCRGQGIGSFILENAVKFAQKKDYQRLVLNVTFHNDGAYRLYERFGFKVSGKNDPPLIFKGKGTLDMVYNLNKD